MSFARASKNWVMFILSAVLPLWTNLNDNADYTNQGVIQIMNISAKDDSIYDEQLYWN